MKLLSYRDLIIVGLIYALTGMASLSAAQKTFETTLLSIDLRASKDGGQFAKDDLPLRGTPVVLEVTDKEGVSLLPRIPYFRLYNPNSGEHFYTENRHEYLSLGNIGWRKENIAYFLFNKLVVIESVETKPWFRLYNRNSGLHHWTLSRAEYEYLGSIGWSQEGIAGYFFDRQVTGTLPLYRLYNPNDGQHHWTQSSGEKKFLVNLGWRYEGIAGYVFES